MWEQMHDDDASLLRQNVKAIDALYRQGYAICRLIEDAPTMPADVRATIVAALEYRYLVASNVDDGMSDEMRRIIAAQHWLQSQDDDPGPMITSEGTCSNCGAKIELDLRLSELDFQVEESGVQPGTVHGPAVHWAAGTIKCASCGVRLPFETSSD